MLKKSTYLYLSHQTGNWYLLNYSNNRIFPSSYGSFVSN